MSGSLYSALFDFALLYILAKLIEKGRLTFYIAGPLYALGAQLFQIVPLLIAQQLMNGSARWSQMLTLHEWPHLVLTAVIAMIIFFFLQRYEDTLAMSLITFMIGFIVLVVVL